MRKENWGRELALPAHWQHTHFTLPLALEAQTHLFVHEVSPGRTCEGLGRHGAVLSCIVITAETCPCPSPQLPAHSRLTLKASSNVTAYVDLAFASSRLHRRSLTRQRGSARPMSMNTLDRRDSVQSAALSGCHCSCANFSGKCRSGPKCTSTACCTTPNRHGYKYIAAPGCHVAAESSNASAV